VSFDPEPALSCHSQDRPPKGHWRPDKIKVKTDEYFKVFLPKKPIHGYFITTEFRKEFVFKMEAGCS
jgi:hypothetical protein